MKTWDYFEGPPIVLQGPIYFATVHQWLILAMYQIASEAIREDLNSKFSPEGWWDMPPDPPMLLLSCYHPVSPPKSCMKPWVYFEVNFIFLTINVFVCPTWLLPKINIPTSGESTRVFQNYVCVQFVCKLCQRCSAIHAFLTTGWLWWLAGFHTGFWVGGGKQVVSCSDPTQLTRGEGVWCHKSKSLGQRKYQSLVIVSVGLQICQCE